jgi:regulator of sigma E protease
MEMLLVIFGLVLFVGLVVVHEWGHFIMARRNGVDVEEFGIGFPPKLATVYRDKKGTEYTLNLLPLGGFVRLKGEHDADRAKGSFGAASFWAKTKIILAGVTMNLVTAWLVFTLLSLVGIPKLPLPSGEEQFTVASDTRVVSNDVYVGWVEPGGPADKAGVKPGDRIDLFGPVMHPSTSEPVNCTGDCLADLARAEDLRSVTESQLRKGASTLKMTVLRDGALTDIVITPRSLEEVASSQLNDEPKGYLGVLPYNFTVQRSTWSAPIVGAGLVAQYSKLTYQALGKTIASLFQGKGSEASANVSGPIGIFVVLQQGASLGLSYILLIIGLLSLTLAIMNTLPIPALDGGKLFVMALFRILRKPLTARREELIHGSGFALLMVLFVVLTVVDIRRFF